MNTAIQTGILFFVGGLFIISLMNRLDKRAKERAENEAGNGSNVKKDEENLLPR
jgi:hypothetical protein